MLRRSARRAALAAVLTVSACLGAAGPAHAAAAAPRILIERPDPLQTRPVGLQVAVVGADGAPLAFSGTVVLAVGGSSAGTRVSAAAGEVAAASIDTSHLGSGLATLRARVTAGGRTVTSVLRWFAEIPPAVELTGFSCTAIPPGGGPIRWAVARLSGDPVPTPNSRDVPLLPYVPSSTARTRMTGADGLPLATSGSVVILQGTKRVATQPLTRQVRRLVFGTTWSGRVGGAFRPGAYTARITLRDAAGGVSTAEQQVLVLAKGVVRCGA